MAVEGQKEVDYWDVVAFETEREELDVRLAKWRKAARNWLAHYAEKKTYDFIAQTFQKYVHIRENAEILDVGFYGMVNCVTVLQHIFDDKKVRRAIHEMVRVVKPLGYILLFEAAPSFYFKNKTPHVHYIGMKTYIREFEKAGAQLIYWRATDLSFPITFFGLRKYAATFSKKAYYFLASKPSFFPPNFLSFLSKILVLLAKPIDYGLADSPLGFLSIGKILLFRKVKKY